MLILFFIFFLFLENAFILLMTLLFNIFFFIVFFFINSINYWNTFLYFISFLVGLFLLFAYIVSFSSKNSNLRSSITIKKNFFFFILLSLIFILFFNFNHIETVKNFNSNEMFYWIYTESLEIINVSLIIFVLLVTIIFWLIKITKKSIKSSI